MEGDMDNEGATEPAGETYQLIELIEIHRHLVKSNRLKMSVARDKIEDLILAMTNDLTYD